MLYILLSKLEEAHLSINRPAKRVQLFYTNNNRQKPSVGKVGGRG